MQQVDSLGQPEPPDSPASVRPSRLARLQQNLNLAGVQLFLQILGGNRSLAIPHITVRDVSQVDWAAIRQAGYKGVVFDKDNTLTAPFELQIDHKLQDSVARCKAAFGSQGMALYSNSAGLQQYDPDGAEAEHLEASLGIHVLRHREKKPAGGVAEVAAHFGCTAQELVMVGDRYLTDIVFGNRHGMLTVRPEPLVLGLEPAGVKLARYVEETCVARWMAAGVQPPALDMVHAADLTQFVTASLTSEA